MLIFPYENGDLLIQIPFCALIYLWSLRKSMDNPSGLGNNSLATISSVAGPFSPSCAIFGDGPLPVQKRRISLFPRGNTWRMGRKCVLILGSFKHAQIVAEAAVN